MKPFYRRIFWRLLAGLGVLWAAASLTFVAINVTSGDLALTILGGADALPTPEVLARVRQEYHLDRPIIEQYALYIGRLATGDLGESYSLRIPVKQAIAQQITPTLQLAFSAGIFAVIASILIALFTARRSPWVRASASGSELIISSVPNIVVGLGLLLFFAFYLDLLPSSGQDGWRTLILPSLTVAVPLITNLSQVLRNELEETLEQPFITTARARGLSEAGVRLGHALRHALIPLVTLSGFIFGNLLGGAVFAEAIFARQGIGRLMSAAAGDKDVPLVLGITLFAAAVYVVVHIIVDLLTTVIDPRAKAD